MTELIVIALLVVVLYAAIGVGAWFFSRSNGDDIPNPWKMIILWPIAVWWADSAIGKWIYR